MIHAFNQFMQQSLNPLLTKLQHFLEAIPLKVADDFNGLTKMGFTLKASKKSQRTISVVAGLTLLTTLFVDTRFVTFKTVISSLPLALAAAPMISFSMKRLFKSVLVFFNLGSHHGGSITGDSDVNIDNGFFNLMKLFRKAKHS